ncbi:MAG TPA: site-2 protease family protein [Opitutaceae bacterium]
MPYNLIDGVWWYLVFVISTTCHEAAHAWAALKLGDDTAFRGGQVSLNPWPHIKRAPFGMVVVPIISWLMGGWLLGWASAPYNITWAQNYPRRAGLMAMAGPAANLVLAVISLWLLRLGLEWHWFLPLHATTAGHLAIAEFDGPIENLAHFLSIGVSLNLLLCVFNLLPIPPLDGSSLPLLLLPRDLAISFFEMLRSPIVQTIGLMVIYRSSLSWFSPLLGRAADLLYYGMYTP